jgi:hypothetical protein
MPHAAADELRWKRGARQATALLLQAGPDPHCAIWFHHGNEVELPPDRTARPYPDDALEMVLYHLLERASGTSKAPAPRQAELAVPAELRGP